MKLIEYGVFTGQENMQIDSDLLEDAISNQSQEPVFRLYGWSPKCISLGRNQKDNFIKSHDIDVVRRLTGGRALLHDDEITYSCVFPVSSIPSGESVALSYKFISGILIDFFKTLGIELGFGENKKISTHFDYCMLISTGADVCFEGKKFIGSAQCRKQGYILQHGSILFDYNKMFLENLFNEKVEGIVSMKEIMPEITKEKLILELSNFIRTR